MTRADAYTDRGCSYHPTCTTCPLPRCRHDEPGGLQALLDRMEPTEPSLPDVKVSVLPDARRILREEANAAGLTVAMLSGPLKEYRLIAPRFRAAKRMYDELDITKEAIGEVIGGRHYSTIIYAIRRANGATWKEAHTA